MPLTVSGEECCRRQGLEPELAQVDLDTSIADDASATQPAGVKQILVADDDEGVRRVLLKALSTYRVQIARDVAQARRALPKYARGFADYRLPHARWDRL